MLAWATRLNASLGHPPGGESGIVLARVKAWDERLLGGSSKLDCCRRCKNFQWREVGEAEWHKVHWLSG
jgi:hypothetical protein